MDKWKARFLQMAGGLLQVGAAATLLIAGSEGTLAGAILGGVAGVGGLLLWGAGARERALGWHGRAVAEERIEQMEQLLLGLQDDVGQLLEERSAAGALYTPIPNDPGDGLPPLPRSYRPERE